MMNLSVDSKYGDYVEYFGDDSSLFSSISRAHRKALYCMGRNFYFPRYHALLAQLFHSRVGDPSFSLSFLNDLIFGREGRAHKKWGAQGSRFPLLTFRRS